MTYLPVSGLPMIEESEATDEVAQLFEEGKRALETPFVPNIAKAIAISPPYNYPQKLDHVLSDINAGK